MTIWFELALPIGVRVQVVGPLLKAEYEGQFLWTVEGPVIFGRGYELDAETAKAKALEVLSNVLLRCVKMVQTAKTAKVPA